MFGNSTVTSQKGSRIREWEEKVFVTMIESHNHSKEFSASAPGENPVFFFVVVVQGKHTNLRFWRYWREESLGDDEFL